MLRAVRRVLGQVEIDRDAPDASAASPMLRDDGVGQRLAEAVERPGRRTALEARDRRLRRESLAGDRIAVEQQLVDRVVRQRVGVVGVGMPAGDAVDALRQQVAPRVPDTRGVAAVGQRGREAVQQAELTVGRFEQHRPAVGARMRLVEGHLQRTITEVGEENRLCYGIGEQRQRLWWWKVALSKPFVPLRGVSVTTRLHVLMNCPG